MRAATLMQNHEPSVRSQQTAHLLFIATITPITVATEPMMSVISARTESTVMNCSKSIYVSPPTRGFPAEAVIHRLHSANCEITGNRLFTVWWFPQELLYRTACEHVKEIDIFAKSQYNKNVETGRLPQISDCN